MRGLLTTLSIASLALLSCGHQEAKEEEQDPALAVTLAAALDEGDAVAVTSLLIQHPNLVTTPLDEFGNLPLHVAVRTGSLACVEALLQAGAPVDLAAGPQELPASFVLFDTYPPRTDVLEALLATGADPTRALPDGTNLLVAACRNGQTPPAALQMLIDAGADPRAAGAEGLTALHWAVINDRPAHAAVLMEAGVYPNDDRLRAYDMTPLEMAFLALQQRPEGLTPAQFSFAQTHQLVNRGETAMLTQITQPVPQQELLPAVPVVRAWLDAVQAGDRAAADACGTADFVARERDWKRSFSNAFFTEGATLVDYEIGIVDALESGDVGGAMVSVRATLAWPDDPEDGEGMRFELVKVDGVWKIASLK